MTVKFTKTCNTLVDGMLQEITDISLKCPDIPIPDAAVARVQESADDIAAVLAMVDGVG